MSTKTETKAVALGTIKVSEINESIKTLGIAETNQANVLINWNDNLVKEGLWFDMSHSILPIAFTKAVKENLAVEFFNMAVNKNLLGYFIATADKNVKRVETEKEFKISNLNEKKLISVDDILNADLKNTKTVYGAEISNFIRDVRRKFTKDYYSKKLNKWQSTAKELFNADNDSETLKKEKANRNHIEMIAWNLFGEPDKHSNGKSYDNAMERKVINSKDNKKDAKAFKKIFSKALQDYQNEIK